MWSFLGLSNNWPFSSALALMLIFALVEGVGTLVGAGLSGILDALLPDMDFDLSIDAPDIGEPSLTVKFLSWLRVGELPALIILIIFLTSFGLLGLAVQSFSLQLTGFLLPAWLASIFVFPVSLPCVRFISAGFAKIMPKDETQVVSSGSFVGHIAYLTLGEAHYNSPAQAKLKDRYGHTHYIMVQPDEESAVFKAGDELLITEHKGSLYHAIHNPNQTLSNH